MNTLESLLKFHKQELKELRTSLGKKLDAKTSSHTKKLKLNNSMYGFYTASGLLATRTVFAVLRTLKDGIDSAQHRLCTSLRKHRSKLEKKYSTEIEPLVEEYNKVSDHLCGK